MTGEYAYYMGLECDIYPIEPFTPGYNIQIGRLFAAGLLGARPNHELTRVTQADGSVSVSYSYFYEGTRLSSITAHSYYYPNINESVTVSFTWQ